MKLKRLPFGPEIADCARDGEVGSVSRSMSVLFAALIVAFGAVFLAAMLEKSLEARGDREHLAHPAGGQAAALRPAGEDPTALKAETASVPGTRWLHGIALASGLVALLAGAWLCARMRK